MHNTTSGTPSSRTADRDLRHESDDQVQTDSTPAIDSPFGETVIDAKNVGFAYGDHVILDGFNLDIKAGEIVALIGPSGCGKSTFLNLIAGIITPTQGDLSVHGVPVRGLSKSVSYMTQQDTLLPWRTALDNAALPLEIKHVPKQARYARARAELDRVGVAEAEKRRPHELSGGMRSRLSLARSLLGDADIFLMDEPFAAIDAILRVKLQQLLVDLWTETHKTIVYVTHDLNEAICLGHRVIVMPSGTSGFYEKVIDRPHPRNVGTFRTEREVQDIYAELWGALGQDH